MSINIPSRYIPTGEVFSGGMGDVILCKDKNLERLVAIKVIKNNSDLSRIHDEIKALQKIHSKHVVQVLDIFIDDQSTVRNIGVVQEYVEGKDISSIAGNIINLENYLKTLFQIASGISDIHLAGLIHRDVKPNNMKFDNEGIIKIFDFGLTRFEGRNDWTSGFRGTFGFAAPELYQENSSVFFTKAIDVYAFGIIAWYLIDPRLPEALLKRPPKLDNLSSFLSLMPMPSEVAEILDCTFHKDAEQRPDITTIRDTIARYLLYEKHQALITSPELGPFYLDRTKKIADLNYADFASIQIKYDGLDFSISGMSGNVLINNTTACLGSKLLGSCVITLGDSHRKFITFDISHPEVVL